LESRSSSFRNQLIITQISSLNSYGVMVDESTRGENRYLVIVFIFWKLSHGQSDGFKNNSKM